MGFVGLVCFTAGLGAALILAPYSSRGDASLAAADCVSYLPILLVLIPCSSQASKGAWDKLHQELLRWHRGSNKASILPISVSIVCACHANDPKTGRCQAPHPDAGDTKAMSKLGSWCLIC